MIVNLLGIRKFILGVAERMRKNSENEPLDNDLDKDDEIYQETENALPDEHSEVVEPNLEQEEDLSNENDIEVEDETINDEIIVEPIEEEPIIEEPIIVEEEKECEQEFEKVEYAIFPQKVINITQRANGAFSHKNLQAWDLADIDSNIQQAFAPCTVIVLAKPTSNANTVLFGSCDEQGNPRAVMTENGTKRILTFALTHDDYIGDIKIGEIYRSGEKIYDEGKAGKATGNHIHIEVAEGWQYKKITDKYGHYRIVNIVPIADIFYQLNGWNEIKNANYYTFKEVEDRFYIEKLA